MKRWKYRPVSTRWTKRLLEPIKRVAGLRREGCLFVRLTLAEYHERSVVKVDITPTDAAASLIVGITKHFAAADARIRK
jgi:hypothetical protein